MQDLRTILGIPSGQLLYPKQSARRPVCGRNSGIRRFRLLLDDEILMDTLQAENISVFAGR